MYIHYCFPSITLHQKHQKARIRAQRFQLTSRLRQGVAQGTVGRLGARVSCICLVVERRNPPLVDGLYTFSIWLVYGESMDNLWIWLVVD